MRLVRPISSASSRLALAVVLVLLAFGVAPQLAAAAPNPPTGLTASSTAGQVTLSWTASTSTTATGYWIYRNGSLIGSATASPYADTTAVAGTAYSYYVVAIDWSGAMSSPSNTVSVTAGGADTTAPSAPSGLTATPGNAQVTLRWTASTDNVAVTGYRVYRGTTLVGSPTTTSFTETGLTNGTSYAYTVKAIDAAGNLSTASASASATPSAVDTTAPSAPTGLTATAGNAQVTLSWAASTDNVAVTGYRVYRGTTLVGSPTTTSFTETGLTNGTGVTYTVKAIDAAGNLSSASASASATPTAPSTLPAPTNLAAKAGSASVALTWTASAGASGYMVYRDGAWVTTISTTAYTDTTVSNGTTYTYTVKAYDATRVSAASSPATASPVAAPAPTDTTPPSPPGIPSVAAGDGQVTLSWAASTDNVAVTGYRVYRGTTLVGSPTGTTFTDTGLANGAVYSYTVKAVDAAGNLSLASNAVNATPVASSSPPPTGTCAAYGSFTSLSPPGSCWRPYAATSPLNRVVPANPRYYTDATRNTDSAKIVARLVSWGSAQSLIAGQTGTGDWWHPLYYSQATDPAYTIHCTKYSGCELEGKVVRIPAGAKPAGGGDGHMSVVDQTTGTEYDMWQAATPSGTGGTLNISFGGITRIDGDGLGSNATAAHFGLAAGIVRGAEMQAGAIAHALFSQIKCTGGYAVYPAAAGTTASSCSTFGLANQDAPPLGARLWLDLTSSQIDALAVPAWKKTLLKAMHDYGIVVGDTNGGHASWGIQAESEQSYASFGRTSYWRTLGAASGLGTYSGGYVFDIQSGVDWAGHLHVLDPCVSQGTC